MAAGLLRRPMALVILWPGGDDMSIFTAHSARNFEFFFRFFHGQFFIKKR